MTCNKTDVSHRSLAIEAAFGFDFAQKKVTFFDDGRVKMSISTWPQVSAVGTSDIILGRRVPQSIPEADIHFIPLGRACGRCTLELTYQPIELQQSLSQ